MFKVACTVVLMAVSPDGVTLTVGSGVVQIMENGAVRKTIYDFRSAIVSIEHFKVIWRLMIS